MVTTSFVCLNKLKPTVSLYNMYRAKRILKTAPHFNITSNKFHSTLSPPWEELEESQPSCFYHLCSSACTIALGSVMWTTWSKWPLDSDVLFKRQKPGARVRNGKLTKSLDEMVGSPAGLANPFLSCNTHHYFGQNHPPLKFSESSSFRGQKKKTMYVLRSLHLSSVTNTGHWILNILSESLTCT